MPAKAIAHLGRTGTDRWQRIHDIPITGPVPTPAFCGIEPTKAGWQLAGELPEELPPPGEATCVDCRRRVQRHLILKALVLLGNEATWPSIKKETRNSLSSLVVEEVMNNLLETGGIMVRMGTYRLTHDGYVELARATANRAQ